MKKNIRLIIAIVAGLAAVFMVMSYLKQQEQVIVSKVSREQKAKRGASKIVIAKRNIPEGTALSEKDLALKEIPEEFVQPRTTNSPERVLGRITNSPIEEGEQILLTKLSVPESATSLAMKTPPGKRAITIPLDALSGFSGMLRPSDHVDVMITMNVPSADAQGKTVQQPMILPLFQNVLVLAVGSDIGGGGAKDGRGSAQTVTFALTAQEASLIAYVQEQSKIRLVLRSPSDAAAQQLTPVSPQVLFQYLSSQMPQQPQQEQPREEVEVKEPQTVEIYRGMQKQVVTLGE